MIWVYQCVLVLELFHVKTSLSELNKNRDNYVIANLVITGAMEP